ncbi:helix-turn-helix domain-containing protein [Brevundimonas naejangsanensis]|uniref:helix-turn-helix domain-containing protein n=1 Tax=Brevundimonas naejangsanensis TaxID=588932 RepID=UPI0034D3A14C
MSAQALAAVDGLRGIRPLAKFVLLTLADSTQHDWSWSIGYETLSQRTCMGARALDRELDYLERHGLISLTECNAQLSGSLLERGGRA